jgi:DNA polymerase III sliding clamp (beta) subunit (PCNA family)
MKIDRKELLRVLESCYPGIARTENVEQSDCYTFVPGGVIAYNEEICCFHAVPTQFNCAVPARPIIDTLRKLSEDEVDIELVEGRLMIKCPGMRRIGITVHQDVVMNSENVERARTWIDVQPAFSDGLAMVADCAAKEAEQFAWTCVEISPKGLQATDGYQAMRYKVECPVERSFLIRRESCTAVAGLGVAAIHIGDDWFGMKTYTGLEVYVRKYTDEFPDLSEVFNAECVSSLRFPPGLLDATQKALPFLADTSTGKQIVIRLKPKKMMIHASNMSGFYEEIRDIDYEGPSRSFALNPKYIQNLLKYDTPCHLGQNTVKIRGDNVSLIASLESAVM